jgi:3-hydroxybutyrate dehydrogenase
MVRLEDKVAVVTGAASGIGKEIARLFAREGAKVVIADRNEKGAEAVAQELGGAGCSVGIPVDVTDEAQVDACFARTVDLFGRLDIVVSNAGVQSVAPIDQFDFSKWRQLLAIHLDGAFLTTRAALRHMYAGGRGGSILYMGSVHSKEASVLKAPYVTAKHGLIGLAKVVAKEGASHGVRANVIYPGFVRTRWSTSKSLNRPNNSASPSRTWSATSCSRKPWMASSPRSTTSPRPRSFLRPSAPTP